MYQKALVQAKEYADSKNLSLITINSWNKWTETSYLETDNIYGYGYLQAIKKYLHKFKNIKKGLYVDLKHTSLIF